MLVLLFCQSFRCFRCLRDRKFNEILNERHDYEFCSLSLVFFAVFFDQTSMI